MNEVGECGGHERASQRHTDQPPIHQPPQGEDDTGESEGRRGQVVFVPKEIGGHEDHGRDSTPPRQIPTEPADIHMPATRLRWRICRDDRDERHAEPNDGTPSAHATPTVKYPKTKEPPGGKRGAST